jgi:endonuclease YncB( thermonuclease family)
VDGQLFDIGGDRPKILYVNTPTGQRQFNSDEVALVVLNPTGAAATTAGGSNRVSGAAGTLGRRQTTTFTIPANQQWTETDVNVRDGDTLELRVAGEIEYAPNVKVSAAGAPRRTPGGPDVPIANAPAGALIGRVDNGQPFLIGRNTSVRMPASGTLFLGINDDTVNDNSGNYRVIIAR